CLRTRSTASQNRIRPPTFGDALPRVERRFLGELTALTNRLSRVMVIDKHSAHCPARQPPHSSHSLPVGSTRSRTRTLRFCTLHPRAWPSGAGLQLFTRSPPHRHSSAVGRRRW